MKKHERIDLLTGDQITVLLADDHGAYRRSLKLLVEVDGDIEVVGEAKNGSQAVKLNKTLHPDVVLMDIAMPLLNGLQATRQIKETSSGARILILSSHPDSEYIEQAMIFGASGYLLKQSSSEVLAQAIRDVRKGKACFSAVISKQLRDHCQKIFDKSVLFARN